LTRDRVNHVVSGVFFAPGLGPGFTPSGFHRTRPATVPAARLEFTADAPALPASGRGLHDSPMAFVAFRNSSLFRLKVEPGREIMRRYGVGSARRLFVRWTLAAFFHRRRSAPLLRLPVGMGLRCERRTGNPRIDQTSAGRRMPVLGTLTISHPAAMPESLWWGRHGRFVLPLGTGAPPGRREEDTRMMLAARSGQGHVRASTGLPTPCRREHGLHVSQSRSVRADWRFRQRESRRSWT
jgi:hypothetical protein